MISGRGIPMDAVVADFAAGAAEILSPAADDDHWDVIGARALFFTPLTRRVAGAAARQSTRRHRRVS